MSKIKYDYNEDILYIRKKRKINKLWYIYHNIMVKLP